MSLQPRNVLMDLAMSVSTLATASFPPISSTHLSFARIHLAFSRLSFVDVTSGIQHTDAIGNPVK